MDATPTAYKRQIFKASVFKRRNETILFEEPLINVDLTPTGEVDPLLVESTPVKDIPPDDEFYTSGFSIFSTPIPKKRDKKKKPESSNNETTGEVEVKLEVDDGGIRLKTSDDLEVERTPSPVPRMDPSGLAALREAMSDIKYLCPKCCFRSPDPALLETHQATHRPMTSRPRPCSKCFFVGKTVRELTAHRKTVHPRSLPEDLPTLPTGEFKCPHCDFISFHKSNLRSHLRVHTQTTVFTCDKCPYSSINKINIENHAVRHLQTRKSRKWKYECKHCGLREKTEKMLARHLILHGEGEMLQCGLCQYKTPHSHVLTQHTRICHGISTPKAPSVSTRGRRMTRRTKERQQDEFVPTEHVQLEFTRRRRRPKDDPTPPPPKLDKPTQSYKRRRQATPPSTSDESSCISDSNSESDEGSSDKSQDQDWIPDSGSEQPEGEAKRPKEDRNEESEAGEEGGEAEEEGDGKPVLVLKRSGTSFTCVPKEELQ